MRNLLLLVLTVVSLQFWSCASEQDAPLPYLGFHEVDPATGDSLYHTIPSFTFVDQDSQEVTNASFAGKVYIADFFFTSCPTICPKVKQQMLRVYDKYRDNDRVMLLSHTIDPKRDTVGKLKQYATGLGAETVPGKWRFVTGDKDKLYDIANDYMSIAIENPDAPGGFDHSGYIILVDGDGHVRAYADGTKEAEVDIFLQQVDQLLAEGV